MKSYEAINYVLLQLILTFYHLFDNFRALSENRTYISMDNVIKERLYTALTRIKANLHFFICLFI